MCGLVRAIRGGHARRARCQGTGIRNVPSGPLWQIDDDRFIPGLSALVEHLRRTSGGQTRLFIQLIDFLAIRRRPDADRIFAQFLRITGVHRVQLGMEEPPESVVRERLAALGERERAEVLPERELEALLMRARERVTDTDRAHIADLPA